MATIPFFQMLRKFQDYTQNLLTRITAPILTSMEAEFCARLDSVAQNLRLNSPALSSNTLLPAPTNTGVPVAVPSNSGVVYVAPTNPGIPVEDPDFSEDYLTAPTNTGNSYEDQFDSIVINRQSDEEISRSKKMLARNGKFFLKCLRCHLRNLRRNIRMRLNYNVNDNFAKRRFNELNVEEKLKMTK